MISGKAVRIHQCGGPEVLTYEDMDFARPGAHEVLIRHMAVGLNFIDVYFRTGLYPSPTGLPFIPGNEGAGVIVETGADVSGLKPGDRVAYASTLGAYASHRIIGADKVVKIPDSVTFETAAAMMLKGMTAEYLLCRTFEVKPGHAILFHAAAGGVGLIAGQWAKSMGATVIGTARGADKAALARANGYDYIIDYSHEDLVGRVKEITNGKGVDVVYDSIGKDTWERSLDCLKPRGMFATFGQSSGPIEGFTLAHLAARGSLFATRPSLFAYTSTRADLELSAGRLFEKVASGKVSIAINQTFPLEKAHEAHRALEGRATTGATILIP